MTVTTPPRVDIITTTYNHASLIRACIDSVLAQTVHEWRMFVIDDGSTDTTPDIAESYDDPRIEVVRLPHRGLGALADSYNAALSRGSAPLVAILEGDDAWPADKLELQIPSFDDAAVMLSWGASRLIDESGTDLRRFSTTDAEGDGIRFPLSTLFAKLVRRNIVAPAVTVMVRRTALQQVGGFQQKGARNFVDLPTWLALSAHVDGAAVYMNHVLGLYRLHADQTTQQKLVEMVQDHYASVEACVAALDARERERIGWSDSLASQTRVRSDLSQGSIHLRQRNFADARGYFSSALANATPSDLPHALAGLLSTVLHRDLVSALRTMRGSDAPTWNS